MSKVYLYSTMTNSQNVVVYEKYPGSAGGNNSRGSLKPSVRKAVIHINGGANLIDHALVTPKGVVTEINEDQLKALKEVSCFNRWVDKGYILVETSEGDADDVAADMEEKDNSAQITTKDHEDRFKEGETSADVVVDDPKPAKRRAPKARAPKKAEPAKAETPAKEE